MEYARLLSEYDYADVRIERGADSLVTLKDSETKVNAGNFFGISVRVLKNGAWGFASSNLPETGIGKLLRKAESLAAISRSTSSVSEVRPEKKRIQERFRITPAEEQVSELLGVKKLMEGKDIFSTMLSCSDARTTSEFYSSEGSEIIQEYSHTYLSCLAVARCGTTIQRAVETAASRKGFRGLALDTPCISARERVQRLLKAKRPPKGRFGAVLDPEMTGVLTHEVVGHASEADSVASSESIFAGKRGMKIANGLVNIVDDPSAPYFGHYAYDDEGVKGKKVGIIKNGVLAEYLNSRETARETGAVPNGHARAEDVSRVPIVRMSNTFFLPGKDSKGSVFDLRSGIYLKGMLGGSVDTFTGGFMFKAEEAYRIKNGAEEDLLRDVAITGNILDVLKNIAAVGKDFGTSPGVCGKFGQGVPVEDGGPHIRVNGIVVG
ncbi:TldD/PmbA family protein [Candidatus Micrarchaeota archaeon]|nr:TldD/PmbA family protein [Candidatus Micrarchaeota archaeon]